MKSKRRIQPFALLVALGGLTWLLLPPRDPFFHGRPESDWIKSIQYNRDEQVEIIIPALETAVRRTDHTMGPARWALKQLESQAAANRGAPK
jgi:hypothetical protein